MILRLRHQIAALLFLPAITLSAQQVRVSEPVIRYASPRLLATGPFSAAVVQTSEGNALVWQESIDLPPAQAPTPGDRKLLFAPIGRDGYADLDAMKEVEGPPGPAAVTTDGRNILIATSTGMQVFGAHGEFRDSFPAQEVFLDPYGPMPISAAIVDGEYRSALLDNDSNGNLVIRRGRFGPQSEGRSSWWFAQDSAASVFTGSAGTLVANGYYVGCFLILAPCRDGFAVAIDRGVIGASKIRLYPEGDPAGSPAIASDGLEFLMVWPARAPNCPAGEFSPSCNSIRFGRIGIEGNALDSASGSLLGYTLAVRSGSWRPAIAAAWTGKQYLVVWESTRDGAEFDLQGAFISASGQVTATFPVAKTDRMERQPSISISPSGQAMVTYLSAPDWRIESRTITTGPERGRAARH
jgi:hypothetical protein